MVGRAWAATLSRVRVIELKAKHHHDSADFGVCFERDAAHLRLNVEGTAVAFFSTRSQRRGA